MMLTETYQDSGSKLPMNLLFEQYKSEKPKKNNVKRPNTAYKNMATEKSRQHPEDNDEMNAKVHEIDGLMFSNLDLYKIMADGDRI